MFSHAYCHAYRHAFSRVQLRAATGTGTPAGVRISEISLNSGVYRLLKERPRWLIMLFFCCATVPVPVAEPEKDAPTKGVPNNLRIPYVGIIQIRLWVETIQFPLSRLQPAPRCLLL